MNLYFRLFRVIIAGLLSFRRHGATINFPGGLSTLWFRVMPGDCDINRHMTHSRYVAFTDLGRVDWSIRIGLAQSIRDKGWSAMAAGMHVEYRREIKPFECFRLETRLLGWEGSNALAEHIYFVNRNGEDLLAARALVRVGFYKKSEKRFIQGDEIAEFMRYKDAPPSYGPLEVQFMQTRLTKK